MQLLSLFANVDLGCLGQVELFVGGFFHQVEEGVFEHVLEHAHEAVFEEHALAEELPVVLHSTHRLKLLLELGCVLIAEGWFLRKVVEGFILLEGVETRWLLIIDVGTEEAWWALFTFGEGPVQVVTFEDLMHSLQHKVVH